MERRKFLGTSLASVAAISTVPLFSKCKSNTGDHNSEVSGVIENANLKFNSNGKFKIVQLTDIHWKNGTDNCKKTYKILSSVLDAEKPDLVVFTGDIAVSDNQKKAYDRVASLVIDRKIPWSLVIGNHDHEHDMERKDIIPYLQQKPYFIGCNGSEEIFGYGNYIVPIKASAGNETKAHLYMFDSNAYVEDKKYGYYDWIRFNQIKWYRRQSDALKDENGGNVLPALAFFHIPLPEYNELYNTQKVIGEQNEEVCCPKVNSGLFYSFIEQQDVMGVFVGHDHDDNYIGVLRGIALAYGGVSGLDAYGDFQRAGRVIELYEGKRKFDSWFRFDNRTDLMYHYPNNGLYPNKNTVYLAAASLASPKLGVKYNYYEGSFNSVVDTLKLKPLQSGVLKNFSIEPALRKDYFGFEFNAYINIAETGVYQFTTTADDGVILFIDDKELIVDDGNHATHEEIGSVGLTKGFHKIRILYFNAGGKSKLNVGMASLNEKYKSIPDTMLFYTE